MRSYVEANDDSSGSRSEHNVALAYSADRAVDNAYAHFFVGELLKGLLDSLDGTLYVCLDYDRKLLNGAFLDGGEQVVKSYLVVSLELLFLSFLAALLNEFPCELLVLYSGECIACGGNVRETHDLNRNGRASFLDGSALVVAHYAHSADGHTRDEHVACVESTVLNQHGSDRTSALIQTCLDDRTSSESVGVSLELEYVCGKAYHLKQGVDALAGLSGNRNADNVADFSARLSSGDYEIAVQELSGSVNSPGAYLQAFTTDGAGNYSGYHSADSDGLIKAAQRAADLADSAKLYAKAEQSIINGAAFIPLYYKNEYFCINKDFADIYYDPFNKTVDFTNAKAF